MAQVETYISGKGKWVKLGKDQFDPKFKCWTLDLYLDDNQIDQFKKWGSELHLREDKETHERFIKLRRQTQKLIKGKAQDFDPPEVLGPDGKPWNVTTSPIGNGSDLTCKVVVYDSMKGKGVRLEAVRVDVLVPYEGKEIDTSNVDSPF